MTKGGCCLNGIGLGWGMDRCGGSEGSSGIGIGLHSIVVGCGRVGRVDGRGRGGGGLGGQCRGEIKMVGGGGVWRGLVHLEWKSKETSLLVCGLVVVYPNSARNALWLFSSFLGERLGRPVGGRWG